jgi:hypothetical protein
MRYPLLKAGVVLGLLLLPAGAVRDGYSQESGGAAGEQKEPAEIRLRRTIGEREYKGRSIEGEDRTIASGDSLWRLLIEEKGLSEKRFSQYLAVVRALNPQIKNLDALRVGDVLFLPLRPDEIVGAPFAARRETAKGSLGKGAAGKGATLDYRIKHGDHLHRILREQLGIQGHRSMAQHDALVKDLNPEKKNWNLLQEGEVIRLPVPAQPSDTVIGESKVTAETEPARGAGTGSEGKPTETKPGMEARAEAMQTDSAQKVTPIERSGFPLDYPHRILAREHLALLGQVIEALGNEVLRGGEEILGLKEGTIRLDRNSYPVIYNPKLQQKVIVDPEDRIPASVRSKLADPNIAVPVFPVTVRMTLYEAVAQLLLRLGYQPMRVDRPVVIQEGGIAYEAKGGWMALAPEESGKAQEIFVITLTDRAGEVPDYLTKILALKGLNVKDVLLPSGSAQAAATNSPEPNGLKSVVKHWPRDKKEMIDEFLLAYGIAFGVSESRSVNLREGLRLDLRTDRIFETKGKQKALFFQPVEPEIKKTFQDTYGATVVELDLAVLSHKELITRLLNELGETAPYREHRFSAAPGNGKDRLNIAAWGFLLSNRSLFVTDREIPQPLHRFFFEKGLEIVYFQ